VIVRYCQKCGFNNSLADKYCGGCGLNLSDMDLSEGTESEFLDSITATDRPSQKYSADDLNELVHGQSDRKEKPLKKKELKRDEAVSQDLLDGLFDTDN
jgi:hypothetical protein